MTTAKKLFAVLEFYAFESSLHGVKYIGNSKYSKIVRIFWLFVFIFSMAGFTYYASQVYNKWFIDPDIVITTKLQNVREIPFPAFTVCPLRKLRKEFLNFEQIKANKMSLTTEERKYLEGLLQLQVENYNWPNFDEFIVNATLESSKIIDMVKTTSYDINEALFKCFDRELIPADCNEKYQKVLTSEGYCFTYNSQDYHAIFNENVLHEDFDGYKNEKFSNWNPTHRYPTTSVDEYPVRILGTSNGFDVALVVDVNDNNISGEIRLAFHLPNEIVGSVSKVKYLNYNDDNQLVLNVREQRVDENLRRYRPEKRQCYFDNERKLQFYRQYTKDNCFNECLINYTLNTCGCVKFSMLRRKDTQICNVTKLQCYLNALSDWPNNDEASATSEFPCNCLPPCNAIYYDLLRLDVFDTYESYTRLNFKNTSKYITSVSSRN